MTKFATLLQLAVIFFIGMVGCMSNEEYNAQLENTFSAEKWRNEGITG